MADIIAQGLRGSTSFGADGSLARRPENWREMILMLYPNGQAPLTALTALMSSESTTDPIYHWFEKVMPSQVVTVTGVYSDALTTAWTAAPKSQGADVWVKMSAAEVINFKLGHIITVRAPASGVMASNIFQVLINAAPTVNGASSYVTGKLFSSTFTSLRSSAVTSPSFSCFHAFAPPRYTFPSLHTGRCPKCAGSSFFISAGFVKSNWEIHSSYVGYSSNIQVPTVRFSESKPSSESCGVMMSSAGC